MSTKTKTTKKTTKKSVKKVDKKVSPVADKETLKCDLEDNLDKFMDRLETLLTVHFKDIPTHFWQRLEEGKKMLIKQNDYVINDAQADVEEIAKDPELVLEVLFAVTDGDHSFNDRTIEFMQAELEVRGYTFLKADSLAQEYKIEAFLEELKENPYQLKLVS